MMIEELKVASFVMAPTFSFTVLSSVETVRVSPIDHDLSSAMFFATTSSLSFNA
jgi:hypothetical protein